MRVELTSHLSLGSAILTVAIICIIDLIIWFRIHLAAKKLEGVSTEKKSKISAIAFVLLFGWLLITITSGLLDFYHVNNNFFSPLLPFGFAIPVLFGWMLYKKSQTARKIIDLIPQHWLILTQFSRIGGIVFLDLFSKGILPAYFAIPAGYGDLVVGLSAPIVAFLYYSKKKFSKEIAILWNIIGIIDLIIAIGVGIVLVFPPPFQLVPATPTTEVMTMFPMVLVPVYAVPLGLVLHIYSLKKLFKK